MNEIAVNNYHDMLLDRASNEVAYAFWRKKVSERIKDPEKRACSSVTPVRH